MSEERTKPGLGFKPVSNLASIRTTLAIPDTVCEIRDLFRGRLYLTGEQLALAFSPAVSVPAGKT